MPDTDNISVAKTARSYGNLMGAFKGKESKLKDRCYFIRVFEIVKFILSQEKLNDQLNKNQQTMMSVFQCLLSLQEYIDFENIAKIIVQNGLVKNSIDQLVAKQTFGSTPDETKLAK